MKTDSFEYTPNACASQATNYSLTAKNFGLGGFFLSLPELEFPLFHSGSYSEYKFYKLSPHGMYIHASPDEGVFVIDARKKAVASWRGWFGKIHFDDVSLVFEGEGHPVRDAKADQAVVNVETGELRFYEAAIGNGTIRHRCVPTTLFLSKQ